MLFSGKETKLLEKINKELQERKNLYTEGEVLNLMSRYGWWMHNQGFKKENFEVWWDKNKKK
jgi:hypothetical protein